MHLAFHVVRWAPAKATLTAGNGSEKKQLREMLEAGRLYVIDRGCAEYALFQGIIDAQSSFVGRLCSDAVLDVIDEREISPEAKAAGVVKDVVAWVGSKQSRTALKQPLRVVSVATGKKDSKGNPEILLLATDKIHLPAELVALAYRYRWSVELFFRWFKCVLRCRHLLSNSMQGVEIQAYLALIASLLIGLWTGRKPTKRTYEMVCFYFGGWATEEELLAHIARLPADNK